MLTFFFFFLPVCVKWSHLNGSVLFVQKRNKAATVQLAVRTVPSMTISSQLGWISTWETGLTPGSGSSSRRGTASLHVTCTAHGLCNHPCPRQNQRVSVQWNPCLGFWKNCSLLPRLQRSLSLSKSWSPAGVCGLCCLRCSPQTHRWCCHRRGATRARISSLSSHSTWRGWSAHLQCGKDSEG